MDLAGLVPPGTVKHAYIPELRGKEARKEKPSKEGLLGVEGVPKEVLLQALSRAGVLCEDGAQETCAPKAAITKGDLYEAGLTAAKTARRAVRNCLPLCSFRKSFRPTGCFRFSIFS